MTEALAAIVVAWSAVFASVSLHAVMQAARARRAPAVDAGALAAAEVLLVRPCAGDEPHLERALTSIVEAPRSFDVRVLLAVASADDPAMRACLRASAALEVAGLAVDVVITGASAPNRKADQIARALVAARAAAYVIVADSDVDLAGTSLDALVAPLLDAQVAASWAPPIEVGAAATLADRASMAVLGASLHAFPLLGHLDPGGMVGKLVALSPDALARVGGFGALVRHLGEDMELARRFAASGHASRMAPVVARSLAAGRTGAAVIARYARWIAVIRAQRPARLASYPALFFAAPLLAVASIAASIASPLAGLAALALTLGARLAVARAASTAAGRASSIATLAVDATLADLLLLAAFARALSTRTLTWRTSSLRIDGAGTLHEREATR